VTAHPLDLIAGMDDAPDLDQKDRVVRHIAACATCRSVARTMQRIDGLIAMPEPALPLPERATPREGVRVAGWAFAFAVVVTLVATMAVLVGSSRQTQVASNDACGVLAVAGRSAGVGSATAKAAAIKLPSSLSESWTACGYGDGADRAAPWLLFRSRPTEGREVRGLLVALTTTDRFAFGKFSPASTADGTERWISTSASGLGQAMAVLADPYFFVVTAPSDDVTERLAEAVLAELRRRPWPPLSAASKTDACAVLRRAVLSAGLPTKDASGSPLTAHRRWLDMSVPADNWPFGGGTVLTNVCGFESVAASNSPPVDALNDSHLILRDEPTTRQQANGLLDPLNLPRGDPDSGCCFRVFGWVQIEAGMWMAHSEDSPWAAVAVSDEPYFFAVTQATDEAAIQLARAVLAELKRP
jgi:hypothetical protein